MLDITFKQNEEGLYELKAQFGKDVDPDALLVSIKSLLEMVKKTSLDPQQHVTPVSKPSKRGRVVQQADDAESIVASMAEANKALLISFLEYEHEHAQPVSEIWDIREYARKFEAYTTLMQGKNREQEVTALRYQTRLLRDRGLINDPPDRSLTALGFEVSRLVKSGLQLAKGHDAIPNEESENTEEQQLSSGAAIQDKEPERDNVDFLFERP